MLGTQLGKLSKCINNKSGPGMQIYLYITQEPGKTLSLRTIQLTQSDFATSGVDYFSNK